MPVREWTLCQKKFSFRVIAIGGQVDVTARMMLAVGCLPWSATSKTKVHHLAPGHGHQAMLGTASPLTAYSLQRTAWSRSFMSIIVDIAAREILDSRGNPTLEVDVMLESGAFG